MSILKISVFDTTLRDGAQSEAVTFSVRDKLAVARALDDLGVGYIEAGNPGSNPKDMAFFAQVRTLGLRAKITAFGSTRRSGAAARADTQVTSLLRAETCTIAVFGKSSAFHVSDVLRTSLDENLEMISDTLSLLTSEGREVVFDAEHFFDGYRLNPAYALKTLDAAIAGGATTLALCDTNGGTLPAEIARITSEVMKRDYPAVIGIHCHNDAGVAVAGSIAAVEAGARQVQGTIIGIGERCGNANLATIIGTLQIKLGYELISADKLILLTRTARSVAEIANLVLSPYLPYVGRSAFTHKGGMHVDGVRKNTQTFEHVDPAAVGNERHLLMSEVAGRGAMLSTIRKFKPHLDKDSPETQAMVAKLKELEYGGYQFEGAESSFELLVRKQLGCFTPHFAIEYFKIIGEPRQGECSASAIIKIRVGEKSEITAAEGEGPVNALDNALRRCLGAFYPAINDIKLVDFKVRVIDSMRATAAQVRVLIESTDGEKNWSTVGVSTDIIEASLEALVDAMEYRLQP